MVRKISVFLEFVILVLLCGCSLVSVSDDVVKADISARFESDFQKVDKIEIIKKNKKEKAEDIYVAFETTTVEAVQKQYYCLNYSYYDKGGWILDSLCEDQKSKWIARPIKGYTPSKEILANQIFSSGHGKKTGYFLNEDITDAFFKSWTYDFGEKDFSSENYIEDVKYSDDYKNGTSSAVVTISAKTTQLRIEEVIELDYIFSPQNACWDISQMKSISHKLEAVEDIVGTYENQTHNKLTIYEVLEDGYILASMNYKNGDQEYQAKYRMSGFVSGYCKDTYYEIRNIFFYSNAISFSRTTNFATIRPFYYSERK